MFDVERSVAGKWSKKEECWVEDGKIAVRWVDGQLLDGWMDKWMDGWMDGFGWVDELGLGLVLRLVLGLGLELGLS
jgi:hypothetical protein